MTEVPDGYVTYEQALASLQLIGLDCELSGSATKRVDGSPATPYAIRVTIVDDEGRTIGSTIYITWEGLVRTDWLVPYVNTTQPREVDANGEVHQ